MAVIAQVAGDFSPVIKWSPDKIAASSAASKRRIKTSYCDYTERYHDFNLIYDVINVSRDRFTRRSSVHSTANNEL